MSTIKNTTQEYADDPSKTAVAMALGLGTGGSDELTNLILSQEAAGQKQLVNSDRLPTKLNDWPNEGDAPYLAVGFTFEPADPRDPMFRQATLPPGWSRQATDHSMWSMIVDEHGRKRVSIFYKAAFYDREAFMSLTSQTSYLNDCLYEGKSPVFDDLWLPPAVARETLLAISEKCAKEAAECEDHYDRTEDTYWVGRAQDHRRTAVAAQKLAAATLTEKADDAS